MMALGFEQFGIVAMIVYRSDAGHWSCRVSSSNYKCDLLRGFSSGRCSTGPGFSETDQVGVETLSRKPVPSKEQGIPNASACRSRTAELTPKFGRRSLLRLK